MKQVTISMAEFEKATTGSGRRAPYGANRALLRDAATKPVRLSFEDEKKAISKQTALYVVRKNMDAQVRILRRGNTVYIGPGEYVRSARRKG